MLASPRPPALSVGRFKFHKPSVGSSKCKRVVFATKATYTRMPMDTPGAYQLIDEDTGEKFIVWGGSEDDTCSSPIPSNEVLSWKPLPSPKNNHTTLNQGNLSFFFSFSNTVLNVN